MQHLKTFWHTGLAVGLATLPRIALAQVPPFEQAKKDIGAIGEAAGVTAERSLPEIVGSIINIVLGFLGILLLAYLLYAGFLWMTAGGDTENVTKAQTMIKNAIIGLVIIVAAFAISNFVVTQLATLAQ